MVYGCKALHPTSRRPCTTNCLNQFSNSEIASLSSSRSNKFHIASVVTDEKTNATLIKAINQNERESSNYRYYDSAQSKPCYVLEVIDFEGRSDLYVTQRQPM